MEPVLFGGVIVFTGWDEYPGHSGCLSICLVLIYEQEKQHEWGQFVARI